VQPFLRLSPILPILWQRRNGSPEAGFYKGMAAIQQHLDPLFLHATALAAFATLVALAVFAVVIVVRDKW
jgi:hypothetical protein